MRREAPVERDSVRGPARVGLAVILAVTLCACATGAATSEPVPLTFVSYGGVYQQAQTDAWLEPYADAHGHVRIVQDSPTDYAKLRAMVNAEAVVWDVVDVAGDFGLTSDEDLLEPIDCAVVACDDLQPETFPTTGYRVPNLVYSVVLGYRTDQAGSRRPRSFADFFDLERFPGKRGAQDWPAGGLLEIALLADGVPPQRLYPLDVERAFAKLDTIKSQIVWWETGAQSAQLLADGEVSIGMSWNGRVFDVQRAGAPVEAMWDQHLMLADYFVIPKGSPHVSEAMRLIAWMTSAEHSAALSRHLPYAPANERAVDDVDPEMAPHLPTSHLATAVPFDDRWWDANFERVDERWRAWMRS